MTLTGRSHKFEKIGAIIFVPPCEAEYDFINAAYEWMRFNKTNENVFNIKTRDDVLNLLKNTKFFDNINKNTSGFLEPYEDDIIFDNKIKLNVINDLKKELSYLMDPVLIEIYSETIRLLNVSIKGNNHIYFAF